MNVAVRRRCQPAANVLAHSFSHTGHIDVAIGYLSGGYREQVLASSYTIGVGLRANNMSPISSSLRVTSYK